MTPAVKEIFANVTSGNMWINRTPRKVSRTGINRTTPGNIVHACGISETSFTPLIGIIGATALPCVLNASQDIGDIWRSVSSDLGKSNKLDTSIHTQFTDNLVVPPIFT